MHSFYTILDGLLVFGVIVFIHELGHYLAARWRGIKVDVFSIGFGPALCSWHDRVGTRWQLSLLPLGGYVKLYGFEKKPGAQDDVTANTRTEGEIDRINVLGVDISGAESGSFHNQPLLSRILVTVMGPAFNIGLTILLFIILLCLYGQPEIRPDISAVMPGSPADKAGLHIGDALQSVDGQKILGVPDFQAQIASHPAQNVQLGFTRQGQTMTLPVMLGSVQAGGKVIGQLGVGFSVVQSGKLPLYRAVPQAFAQTWAMTGQIFEGVWQIISGQRSARQLTGTIGIIHMSGQAASYGLASLLSFIAMLSLNLGLVNLLPIPMLDGGHLLFYAAEAIRGRPLPEKAQNYALQAGVLFVVFLFLFSSYNDLSHLGVFHWFVGRD